MEGEFRQIPENVDWPLLITFLRQTFKHGDGGLAAESGIDPGVISDGARRGVYSWRNGVVLWNLAVNRVENSDIDRCVNDCGRGI